MNYNPKFLEHTNIWSSEELEVLHKMKEDMPLEVFLNSTGEEGLLEAYGFDFIYTSAKIEGNDYDKLEALNLLESGITAGGKKYTDALMILNLRDALSNILTIAYPVDKATLREIHSTIAKDLIQRQNLGSMRKIDVQIGGSAYKPLSAGDRLNAELDYMFSIYHAITDPFNKALYLHHNLAYLQYFEDCNKRTARTMQNISLLRDNLMIFTIEADDSKAITSYKKGLLSCYERGEYEPYKEFFMQNYEKIHQNFLKQKNKAL